jgi:hypothetical protein
MASSPLHVEDFFIVGEFCEIVGPVASNFLPADWLEKSKAQMLQKGIQRAALLDANATLQSKMSESPHAIEWQTFAPRLEACLRSACNGLILRTLTGDISHDPQALSGMATVTIDAIPWLAHPSYPDAEVMYQYTQCPATVSVKATVISMPDACARGFSRTLCLVHVSEVPLSDSAAAKVTQLLQEKATDVIKQAMSVHPREVAELHRRLDFVTTRVSLDQSTEASRSAVAGPGVETPEGEPGTAAPSSPVAVGMVTNDEMETHALEHYNRLQEHQQRRYFEESQAMRRRYVALQRAGIEVPIAKVKFAHNAIVDRLLKKGSAPLRTLKDYLPPDSRYLVVEFDVKQTFMTDHAEDIRRLVYCALCRLPCCIEGFAPPSQHDLLFKAICHLFRVETPYDHTDYTPPTLGDYSANRVIHWHPTMPSSLKHSLQQHEQLPNVVRVRLTVDGFVVTAPEAWIPVRVDVEAEASSPTWAMPLNSIINAVLHGVQEVGELTAAMDELEAYLTARVKHAATFHDGNLLTMMGGTAGGVWHPTFPVSGTGASQDPVWLINCLRAHAAYIGGLGSNVIVPPVAWQAVSRSF